MACPRTDSGLGEPHLWVPRPPGLPINAGVRLSLEGPASTLNGPSAGLHTCPSPPPASTLPPPALPGGPSRRQPVQKGGRRDTPGVTRWPGWPLWSQVKRYVRISRPIRIRPPPGQPAASSAQRGCPRATAHREHGHCLPHAPTPPDAEICSTRPFQMKIWEAGSAGGRQMCESFRGNWRRKRGRGEEGWGKGGGGHVGLSSSSSESHGACQAGRGQTLQLKVTVQGPRRRGLRLAALSR